MSSAPTFTPSGLAFEPEPHRYIFNGHEVLSVTGVLLLAGLVDRTHFTAEDRERGTRVHAAIEHEARIGNGLALDDDAIIGPYLRGWRSFLAESAFRIDACEERLADARLMVAGTLDLRGLFINRTTSGYSQRIDIIDVKTGSTPPWVGYQTAGYVRLLPHPVRDMCRRWCLTLRADASYRLDALTNRHDECVFTSAVTIAHAKKGWLA